ncbi:MAG: Uma2 family endonuclease [Gemmataceae bacterium]
MNAAVAHIETIADLLEQLGDIDPRRVRLQPTPGTATEEDLLKVYARSKRPCELVDGTLVEKVMGLYESRLAIALSFFIELYLDHHNRGFTAGEAGMMRLHEGLVRSPDLSFVSWDQLPRRRIPRKPIPSLYPDLAVEVLSKSNTKKEMDRKLREYFLAGTKLVWYIDPDKRTVRVFTSASDSTLLHEKDTLDGGAVLPGFRLSIWELFARAERSAPPRSEKKS